MGCLFNTQRFGFVPLMFSLIAFSSKTWDAAWVNGLGSAATRLVLGVGRTGRASALEPIQQDNEGSRMQRLRQGHPREHETEQLLFPGVINNGEDKEQ